MSRAGSGVGSGCHGGGSMIVGSAFEVEHRGRDFDDRDAVGERVVRLVQHPDVLAAVEAFDEPDLPQWVLAVEDLLVEPLRQRDQLLSRTRRREGGELDVTGDVEVSVVDPDRTAETEGDIRNRAAKTRDERES